MKEQTSDESIQLLLNHYSIDHPKRKCRSGNEIVNICINPHCQANALYCQKIDCPSCADVHAICEHAYLRAFTQLLQKRASGQRQFLFKVLEIENEMIREIQRRRKVMVQKFYMKDLENRFLKVIQSLYIKKDQNFQLKSRLAEQMFAELKRTANEVSQQPDPQMFKQLKKQTQSMVKQLNDTQTRLIEMCSNKPKIKQQVNLLQRSTILTKDNMDHLKFLKQSFPGVKRFQLIFRASQHGFQAAKFHQYCDGVRHTFTLLKNQFGVIMGGYTPLIWTEAKQKFYADQEGLSFLLSFNLRQKMSLNNKNSAIFNRADCGPAFGGGCDLRIYDKCNQNNNSFANFPFSYNYNGTYVNNQQSYTAFTGARSGNKFKVIQYEVFKVIW